ncbi:Signal transduction response regulator [Minicystis rosea]|nr:Signal transduction response regulator [Minicystis rosea]
MRVEIGGRSLDLLTVLVEQPGRVHSKDELLKRVWPDVVIEDGSLRFHMAGLRKILRDGENGARYIATQVGVGYAFVAPVQRLPLPDHSPSSASCERPEAQHEPAETPRAGSLPARLTHLIGRDHDVDLLTQRLSDTRLFTIVGAGGVGKTTLAVEIGHALSASFGGKVAFVDLGALEDPALIPSAIAGALGIAVQVEDPMRVLLGHIRAQKLLLLLDNCEHLIDAVSAMLERLTESAPQVSVLATSREPLRARGEHVHWLGSLGYPAVTEGLSLEQLLAYPAIELFVERAAAANSTLEIELEAARSIADMCRRLDGMALPIELTAVRVATHGVDATARLLGERFSLGWTGRRTALPRQQTLQATLDWSYDLLSEPEQRSLERLSLFLGPFSMDAAQEVIADDTMGPDTAVRALDQLTAKSLLSFIPTHGDARYRLLEMTRAYARQKLLAHGSEELRAAARRHASYFLRSLLRSLEVAAPALLGAQDGAAQFSDQLGNIRSALAWCFEPGGDLSIGIALAAASAPVFLNLSLLVECRTWCARAAAQLAPDQRGTAIELELQAALGLSLMFTRGNTPAADVALRRALDVAVSLGDRWNQLRLLGRLHIFHERIGDFQTALAWATTAVEVAEAIGEPEATAVAASLAGISHHLAGDQSRAHRELSLSLRKSLPSKRERTIYYGFDHRNRSGIALARTLWLQGHADQARRTAERTVREAAVLEHPITECIALIWMLSVYLWTGDLAKAESALDTFANRAEVNGFEPYITASSGFRGQLMVHRGETREALTWIEESLARLHAARYELLTTSFEAALTEGLTLCGRYEEALELVNATIARCQDDGEGLARPELLRIKARAAQQGVAADPLRAEEWLLESVDHSQRQGARAWELRATIDLARLWQQQGRAAEAHERLQRVRAQFSEGADTADVRAADLLLSALRAL